MAKITWLGEDELHVVYDEAGKVVDDRPGPSFTYWGSPHGPPGSMQRFDKGIPVEVTNPRVIEKAKGNRFFKVEEDKPAAPKHVKNQD